MPLRNSKLYYILILFLLGSAYIHAQGFVKVSGQATDIAMSPKDGSVYVVNASKNIKKYDTRSKKFLPYATQSKNATSVSVTKDGVVYMVSTGKEVSLASNGRWIKIPGIKTSEVICLKDGTIMALDTGKKLRRLYASKWDLATGLNSKGGGVNQVVGLSINDLYVRMSDNSFKSYSRGNVYNLNGKPLKIALDHKTGIVYAVGRNKGIYKWVKNTKKWVLLPGTRKDFKDVAVHNGKIWAVATNKGIYYYDPNKKIVQANTNYAGTYRVTFTRIVRPECAFCHHDFYGGMGIRLKTKVGSTPITISPEGNKTFNVLDIPKNNPRKFRKIQNKKSEPFIWVESSGKYPIKSKPYYWEKEWYYKVDVVREFILLKEGANDKAFFNFQFNLTQINEFLQHEGEWQQVNIPIDEVLFGKEYIFESSVKSKGKNNGICFKIEKL